MRTCINLIVIHKAKGGIKYVYVFLTTLFEFLYNTATSFLRGYIEYLKYLLVS